MSGTDLTKCPARGSGDALLQRFITGDSSPELLAELRQRLQLFVRRRPNLSLEQCLGLATEKARRRQRCAYHVREALDLLEGGLTARCTRLADEFATFRTRGPLKAWRHAGGPPPEATELQQLLYKIANNLEAGDGVSAKTFGRLVNETSGTDLAVELSAEPGDTAFMNTDPVDERAGTAAAKERANAC